MSKVKNVIKKLVPNFILERRKKRKFVVKENNRLNTKIKLIENTLPYEKQFNALLNTLEIKYDKTFYFYNLDYKTRLFTYNYVVSNMPIDYSICMNSIKKIKKDSEKLEYSEDIFNSIENYIIKINKILDSNRCKRSKLIKRYLNNIISNDCDSFDESLQRILFYNQLLWQTNHKLVGLGRLDKILYKYYENDINSNRLSKNDAYKMIKEFLKLLNRDYIFKSSELLGDTGQLLILSGYDENNNCICNDLTYMFIDAVKELQIPDPKILLRVTNCTNYDLFQKSLECVKTGIGSPLFANDEVIIPCLISAGYDKNDVYNYVTSACWEPLILGKSFDQNNLYNILFLEPLNNVMRDSINKIDGFEKMLSLYQQELEIHIKNIINKSNNIIFEEDPLMSIFNYECVEKGIDISKSGAKYNNFGLLSLGLSNTVDSLLVLKKYVFDEKKYSLEDINLKRINNELEKLYIDNAFGNDTKDSIELTQKIMDMASEILSKYNNSLGGKFKYGLSSPGYISNSFDSEASFDGRKKNSPYNVHISTMESVAYTELLQFAGNLDYSVNKYNGNVIDYFVSPDFINNNMEKFIDFLMLSTKTGYFEMQMNVVSSKVLIEAKNNPQKFPNLIVRVWGFSSYFKDLPEEYKKLLIERALISEGEKNEKYSY